MTDIQQVIEEKKKLEDDILTLITDFQKRNGGTSVEEIIIQKANMSPCRGPQIVRLEAKVNIA